MRRTTIGTDVRRSQRGHRPDGVDLARDAGATAATCEGVMSRRPTLRHGEQVRTLRTNLVEDVSAPISSSSVVPDRSGSIVDAPVHWALQQISGHD